MVTEMSESNLEREEHPRTFELQFQIYYSENDFINLKVDTYFKPKY